MSDGIRLRLSFEGQQHQMDLDTLIISLLHFAEMTKAASQEVMPGENLQIKIEAPGRGSFEIWLEFASKMAEGLLKSMHNSKIK